jgi:hypothetical protein
MANLGSEGQFFPLLSLSSLLLLFERVCLLLNPFGVTRNETTKFGAYYIRNFGL